MTDFHTHILPGMDDGSGSLEQSERMLQMEYAQGVRKVIATPHFYAGEDFPEEFFARREKRLDQVRNMLSEESWGKEMQVWAGAEVYYFTGMAEAPVLSEFCVEGTNVLLLEMPFSQWDKEVYRDVRSMIEKRKLTVILAHVERYYGFQKSMEIWDRIFELPVYAQMNADAFISWKKRRLGRKLLREGYHVILGSDCHNTDRRPPNLAEGREAIRKRAGEKMLEQIDRAEESVFD